MATSNNALSSIIARIPQGQNHADTIKLLSDNVQDWLATNAKKEFDAVVTGKNKKAIWRFVQAVNFALSRNDKALETIGARATYALVSISLLCNQAEVRYKDIKFAISASGDIDSAPIKGVKAQTLRAIVGSVGPSSAASMISRSAGKNGFLTLCGVSAKVTNSSVSITKKESPLVSLIVSHLATLSPDRIARLIPREQIEAAKAEWQTV